MESKIWELHDKRLNSHEERFTENARSNEQIKDALKQLMERVNEGVSKTQQRILEENKKIELDLRDISHSIEINMLKMNEKIDGNDYELKKRIEPLEIKTEKINNIYIYSIVGGVILGLTAFASTKLIDRVWKSNMEETRDVSNLRIAPVRERR
jgi:glycyl-tRNA synthetase (class II)